MNNLSIMTPCKYLTLNGLRLNITNQTGYSDFSLRNVKKPQRLWGFSILKLSIAAGA
jgi:hypothetical protein